MIASAHLFLSSARYGVLYFTKAFNVCRITLHDDVENFIRRTQQAPPGPPGPALTPSLRDVARSDESGSAGSPLQPAPPQTRSATFLTGTLERTASIEYLSLLARFIQGASVF